MVREGRQLSLSFPSLSFTLTLLWISAWREAVESFVGALLWYGLARHRTACPVHAACHRSSVTRRRASAIPSTDAEFDLKIFSRWLAQDGDGLCLLLADQRKWNTNEHVAPLPPPPTPTCCSWPLGSPVWLLRWCLVSVLSLSPTSSGGSGSSH